MTTINNPTFLAKCPFCAMVFNFQESFRNQNFKCTNCRKPFILTEYQNDYKKLEDELAYYKETNRNLQNEVVMEKLKNKLYSFQAKRNEELHAQIKDERKKYDKTLLERNQEISRLKDQNQKLEQANQNLIKKLSEKDEENCRLKIHNQSLLTQIKKIKSDKKTVEDKLEQLINKESLVDKETMTEPMELQKSSNGKNLMVDKAINTDPVNLTTQKDSVDVKRSSHVEVETSQGYEEDSIPSVNQEEATSTRSKDQVARMPYRHPNHKNRYFNQSMYPQKQMTNMSKIITSITNDAQGRSYHGSQNTSNCLQEPHKSPIVQKIDLRWADSLTIRRFYATLRRSYRFKSSTITNSGIKNKETILQARARDKSSISML
jgi:hypothetical protein